MLFVHARESDAWMLDGLRRSIAQSGQRGDLVVRSDEHPERWRYVILDRVLAFHRAVMECENHSSIAILDPDMVLLRDLVPDVEPGRGQATHHQLMLDAGIAWQLSWAIPEAPGDPQCVDWPVVLHIDDARRLAPVWLDITERAARDGAVASLFSWWLDMFTFAAAAHSLGITFDVSDPLAVVPGWTREVGNAWCVHYHNGVGDFDKRSYVPGAPIAERPEDELHAAVRGALTS